MLAFCFSTIARFTATYSTTYTYLGDSDWLLKETKYPFGGAAFDLVQYRYISPKLMRIVLRDGGACNIVLYLQMNWHGDFYRDYTANGDSFTVQQGDEWGNWPRARLACNTPHAYHWNAQWGYQFFDELGAPNGGNPPLGLYYVHGRWYNPEVGLFLSPDEKGEYFYGSGQNPADWVWAQLRKVLALLEALKSQAYYQTCGNTVNPSLFCSVQPATSPSDLVRQISRLYSGRFTLGPPLDPEKIQAVERAIRAGEIVGIGSRVLLGQQVSGDFPETAGSNEILYRTDSSGKIAHYEVYDADGNPVMRVDLTGRPHGGVPPPHVVEFEQHIAPDGTVFFKPSTKAREALPDEIPP